MSCFKGHKDSVTCTGFSHDSKFVSTGDMSGMIRVWELQTGQEVWNFECGGDLEVRYDFGNDLGTFVSLFYPN